MTQGQVRIWWDTSVSAYRLTSPFNVTLVESLKAFIPGSDRSYDGTTKIWTFTERFLKPVVDLCDKLRLPKVVITRQQAEQASTAAVADGKQPLDTALAEFVRLLPLDAALSAYRKAALLLHPDRGGSMESMSKLNTLWNRIEKELYAGR